MASISIDNITVGNENNRYVKIEATKGAPADPRFKVDLRWCVSQGAIGPQVTGGLGPEVLVFGAGSMDPGIYNVQAYVYDHSDGSTSTATSTFTIPALPLNINPPAP